MRKPAAVLKNCCQTLKKPIYRSSLQLAPDLYTSIAYSDVLLRVGNTAQALRVLQPLPQTDAVLLRQATGMRRLGDTGWQTLRTELRERQVALERRGDDTSLHSREQALVALWLDDDPQQALRLQDGIVADQHRLCHMRHRNQPQLAVVDTVNVVALEVQAIGVTTNLLITGRVAKAQVTVMRLQREQMQRNPLTVARPQRANWHDDALFGFIHESNIRVFPQMSIG